MPEPLLLVLLPVSVPLVLALASVLPLLALALVSVLPPVPVQALVLPVLALVPVQALALVPAPVLPVRRNSSLQASSRSLPATSSDSKTPVYCLPAGMTSPVLPVPVLPHSKRPMSLMMLSGHTLRSPPAAGNLPPILWPT